jgi:hypothetical protein
MTQARPGPIPVIARTNARATAACAGMPSRRRACTRLPRVPVSMNDRKPAQTDAVEEQCKGRGRWAQAAGCRSACCSETSLEQTTLGAAPWFGGDRVF